LSIASTAPIHPNTLGWQSNHDGLGCPKTNLAYVKNCAADLTIWLVSIILRKNFEKVSVYVVGSVAFFQAKINSQVGEQDAGGGA